jgi:hypothetical protein
MPSLRPRRTFGVVLWGGLVGAAADRTGRGVPKVDASPIR